MEKITKENIFLKIKKLIGKKGPERIEQLESFWKREKAKPK